ncbi:MAG: hypothetical protein MSH22_13550 [Spirochaetia bacterium]|nr:hypothetical protein [Spirochaetia bacterium]
MKKNIFTAFFAVCALFLVSSCSEPDDDNSALMMQVVQQSQGSNSVSKNAKKISGTTKDGSKYELEITTDYVSGNGTLSLRLTSADENVLQLLTIKKSSTGHSLIFTHKDSKETFTNDSYTGVSFMADSVPVYLENHEITVPDVHSFIVNGKIPSATIDKIKNCTTLEFILNDNKEVSPQISISFEDRILTNIKRFM